MCHTLCCGLRWRKERAPSRSAPTAVTFVLDPAATVTCSGDRVLVQKFVYDLRRPVGWEIAVFHNPNEPSQAYVKRVVGLPGESIQIVQGDVWIDGQIARKTLREQRAMRILVDDNNFLPQIRSFDPRWLLRCGERRPATSEQVACGGDSNRARIESRPQALSKRHAPHRLDRVPPPRREPPRPHRPGLRFSGL